MTSLEHNDEQLDNASCVAAVADALHEGRFEEVLTEQGYANFHDVLSAAGHCHTSRVGELFVQLFFANPEEIIPTDDDNFTWLGIYYDFTLEGLDMELEATSVSIPVANEHGPSLNPEGTDCLHIIIPNTEVAWEKF